MKALILAAGIGSRLRPITEIKPKCLVSVAGRPILDYQIQAYASAGIRDIIIVAGHKVEKIRQYCNGLDGADVKIIENTDYATTNNMYSLYLAAEELKGREFILSNGDVIFSSDIISSLMHAPSRDLIAAQASSHNEESMKITINQSGYICDISKTIPQKTAYGTSIDVYVFSQKSSEILFEQVQTIVEKEKKLNEWTEVALQRLLKSQKLKMQPFDIGNKEWVEIDNYQDLLTAERYFSEYAKSLFDKKLFFIDLDGTVYIGDEKIPGAQQLVELLKNRNIPYYFLSNNSARSKSDYVEKLSRMGIDVEEDKIILSTDGLLEYLKSTKIRDIFLVGTRSMAKYIAAAGINTRSSSPEYVVLGYDTELTYEKLRQASIYLINGVPLLATHADIVCPSPQGPVPDIGSMLALIEKATAKRPLKVFGKPNKKMIQHIMERHKVSGDETVIIGDRLYTDMELARKSGSGFVLVLSGETKREDIESSPDWPDLIVKSLEALY